MRRVGKLLFVWLVGAIVAPGAALAIPITHTIFGVGSGELGGQSFQAAAFEITAEVDTDDVRGRPFGRTVVHQTLTVTVVGIGTATFTHETSSTNNRNFARHGFGDLHEDRLIIFVVDEFDRNRLEQDLGTSLGGVLINPSSRFQTDMGRFGLTGVSFATFRAEFPAEAESATANVPEPGGLVLLGLASLLWWRRSRSAARG